MKQSVLFPVPEKEPEPEPEPEINGNLEALRKKKQAESDARNEEIEKQRREDIASGYWHEKRNKEPVVIYVREVEFPDRTRFVIWQTKDVDSTGSRLFNPLMPLSETRKDAEAKLNYFAKKNGLKHF